MGYRKIPTIYTLKLPGFDGLEIRMKGLRLGRVRRLVRLLESEEEQTLDAVNAMVDLINEGLVSWNLEDEDGVPIDATSEEVEELELPMILELLNEWLDRMTGVDEDLGKDSGSGAISPVQLPTMEAL